MSLDLRPEHVVRVMSIDPSTTNLGVWVIDVNIAEKVPFKLVYASTLYGEQLCYDVPAQFDDTNETGVAARSYCMSRAVDTLLDLYKPDTGICEDNFLGMSALTFKQLIQCVSLLREAFGKHNIHMSYVLPNLAKAIVGANFKGTQKEDVRKGVLAYSWLEAGEIDLSVLDEHAIDAGAIGLYRCEMIAKQYGVSHHE